MDTLNDTLFPVVADPSSGVVPFPDARQEVEASPRDIAPVVATLRRIERNIQCLADDLDQLGLGDRAEFAAGLAASAREAAAFLGGRRL